MDALRRIQEWNFDIDHYLNCFIPPSPLHKLPSPLSRFLGYRKEEKPDIGNVLAAFYSFLGAFLGLAVIAAVFNNSTSIQSRHPPALVASFGASAILEYNVIRSPLGQPRNAILGHTISALIGVSITKLFLLHSDFQKIRWIAGALACGLSSAAMLLTGTVHPPGGASAVLAATSQEFTDMGWWFVGLIMLGTFLMFAVGLFVNNIQRQFPVYWWTPMDVGKSAVQTQKVEQKNKSTDEEEVAGNVNDVMHVEEKQEIRISSLGIVIPVDFALNPAEAQALGNLRKRLEKRNFGLAGLESVRSSAEVTMVPSHRAASDTSAEVGV